MGILGQQIEMSIALKIDSTTEVRNNGLFGSVTIEKPKSLMNSKTKGQIFHCAKFKELLLLLHCLEQGDVFLRLWDLQLA